MALTKEVARLLLAERRLVLSKDRSGSEYEWLNENALRIGPYTDTVDYYHPGFVLNFQRPDEENTEFTTLQFSTKFYMPEPVTLDWINGRNAEMRFTRFFWDENSLVVTMDVYAPNSLIHSKIFEANYVLFDHALVLVAAAAKD